MKTLTKIIRAVLIYFASFVTVCFIAAFRGVEIPDALIQYGLGGGAVELAVGGMIEIAKHKIDSALDKEDKDDDSINVSDTADDSCSSQRCNRTGD